MKDSLRAGTEGTRRLFWTVLLATTAFKFVVAASSPITVDEAYFVTWGRAPALGYYDHGGMLGWWLAAMLQVSDAAAWLRVPAIAVSALVAWLVRRVLQPVDRQLADLAGIFWLLSPAHLLSWLITTDTPLLFFSTLSVVAALRAWRAGGVAAGWWMLSGLCLGAAFVSKYFAVLTGLGIGAWLVFGGARPRFGALALLLAGAMPGIAVNVAWNHANGWANLLFNIGTRNADAALNARGPVLFIVFLAIFVGPLGFAFARVRPSRWRERMAAAAGRWRDTGLAGVAFAGFVPLFVFAAVSLFQNVGLHWLLFFAPWLLASLVFAMPRESVARLLRPAAVYAGVQIAVVTAVVAAPIEWVSFHKSYASVVLTVAGPEVAARLESLGKGCILASDSYGKASLLSYHTKRHVPVVGAGSHHGRHDDWVTDFREFDGRDMLIVTNRPRTVASMSAWFAESEVVEFEVREGLFYACRGKGFKFDVYRESVLRDAARRFYSMPVWLERLSSPAPLVRRYGLQEH